MGMGCVVGFPRGWRCTASLNGWDGGLGNAPKGGRPALANANVSLVCCLLRFYRLLSIFMQGNGMYSGVSKGTGGVLLASMGGMSGRATCQKARRPALAKVNVPLHKMLNKPKKMKEKSYKGMGGVVGFAMGLAVYC